MMDIKEDKSIGYIPQLIFSEFYYKTWQTFGEQAALIRTKALRESPLEEYYLKEKDTYVIRKAKLNYSFLSMVDAVVVATCKAIKSIVVTSDGNFLKIKGIKVKKINF